MAHNLETVISRYLEFKSLVWAKTTMKSETARLNSLKAALFKVGSFDPAAIFRHLKDQGLKPYTITTMMIRLSDLEAFGFEQKLMPEGAVPQCADFQRRYLRAHNKGAYTRTAPKVSFEEAQKRITQITCEETREYALGLLETGLRFFEGKKIAKDQTEPTVEGKGGYVRPVYNLRRDLSKNIEYISFWRQLKKATGLKPHDLRKIAANRFAGKLSVHELKHVMGWRQLSTAESYLQVSDSSALNNRLKAL